MPARNLRAVAVFPSLMILYVSVGCTQSPQQRAAKSLASGTDALAAMYREELRQKRAFSSGSLWTMRKLAEYTGDGRYDDWVDKMVPLASSNDPGLRLVDPSQPKPVLPDDPGRGFIRFGNFVMAPAGQPEFLARRYVLQFISEPGEGYVLTHQIVVIEWAREQGLTLPASVEDRKKQMLQALEREHDADPQFSDLYAERAAILVMYGDAPPEKMATWAGLIVDAQRKDGTWPQSGQTVVYDGRKSVARKTEASHTQALSLLALAGYLKRR